MANSEHLEILKQGVEKWNQWRDANPEILPDLSGTDLRRANLEYANLSNANLSQTNLRHAILLQADLSRANLTDACLRRADLAEADLSHADLGRAILHRASLGSSLLFNANLSAANLCRADLTQAKLPKASLSGANLRKANLYDADLSNSFLDGADLRGADLTRADMISTDFTNADLTGCQIFGASVWNVLLDGATQKDLVVAGDNHAAPTITVDNLEVAQFIYLMLNNQKIRDVIDTITSKAVLILGRFADPLRKEVLDGLRERLREFNLLPIVFDFDRPTDKDYTETVQTLAGMSMFVIVDVTNPKSTPLEMEATVKHFKIPFVPIIDVSVDERPYAMMVDLQKSFHWVLNTLEYRSKDQLLDKIKVAIIDRAMKKRQELRIQKAMEPETLSLDDFPNE
jgi:uncharacterized protein YjbI with pentapeptide repeats